MRSNGRAYKIRKERGTLPVSSVVDDHVRAQIHLLPAQGPRTRKARLPGSGSRFNYTVERKDANGIVRRYLAGVSSGLLTDFHGERMLESAIKGFYDQAEETKPLLYLNHDRNFTESIGVLAEQAVTEDGEWWTLWRLWDSHDDVSTAQREEADTAWKMAKGIAPYQGKRDLGFSVEVIVFKDDIEEDRSGKRQFKYAKLDPGVALVSMPAYPGSVAETLVKSLDGAPGGEPPAAATKGALDATRRAREEFGEVMEELWKLDDDFHDARAGVLQSDSENTKKREALVELFDDYRDRYLELIEKTGFEAPSPWEAGREAAADTVEASKKSIPKTPGEKPMLAQIKAQYEIAKKSYDGLITAKKNGVEGLDAMIQQIMAQLQQLLQQAQAAAGQQPGQEMQAGVNKGAMPAEQDPDKEGDDAAEGEPEKEVAKVEHAMKSIFEAVARNAAPQMPAVIPQGMVPMMGAYPGMMPQAFAPQTPAVDPGLMQTVQAHQQAMQGMQANIEQLTNTMTGFIEGFTSLGATPPAAPAPANPAPATPPTPAAAAPAPQAPAAPMGMQPAGQPETIARQAPHNIQYGSQQALGAIAQHLQKAAPFAPGFGEHNEVITAQKSAGAPSIYDHWASNPILS